MSDTLPQALPERRLADADLAGVAEVAALAALGSEALASTLTVKDISGNSGARTYLCSREQSPLCIVKVSSGGGIMDSHPHTRARVQAATAVLRDHGIAPSVLLKGADFHVERAAGTSVMKDFFHFDPALAPLEALADLLARLHSVPTDWYAPLREQFLTRDPRIDRILRPVPAHAPCWCLPWSGFDTGMPVLGVGNPAPATAKKILTLQLESGVFEAVMQCPAFWPTSAAAKRQVVVHNDFKPDNVLRDEQTGGLTAIDYDLVQVGPAVMDFGLPFMMWLGARFTTADIRRRFVRAYLSASGLPAGDTDVRAFLLDCEVNTLVAFPGLLANLYDAEVPLLRGVVHPTTKPGHAASGPDARPTGRELVALLAEAVEAVRGDAALADRCIEQGLVVTMFQEEAWGSPRLASWLREMQKNRMLRLFGIAETDGGALYVSEHAQG